MMDATHKPLTPQPHPFRFGRLAFLGMLGLTGAALVAGRKIPNVVSLAGGTNVDGFTIYTINGFPVFKPDTYRLTVTGMVEHERSYSFADLTAMPAVEETKFYQCVTGWVVPHVKWRGVRLWDLIEASRPTGKATALRFLCMDNAYSESLTFEQAKKSDVLLAYELNGKALSRQQGQPLRLVVPGMYGYKYAKWVNRIEVVDRVVPGYWEQNGYDVDAYIGHSNGLA